MRIDKNLNIVLSDQAYNSDKSNDEKYKDDIYSIGDIIHFLLTQKTLADESIDKDQKYIELPKE